VPVPEGCIQIAPKWLLAGANEEFPTQFI